MQSSKGPLGPAAAQAQRPDAFSRCRDGCSWQQERSKLQLRVFEDVTCIRHVHGRTWIIAASASASTPAAQTAAPLRAPQTAEHTSTLLDTLLESEKSYGESDSEEEVLVSRRAPARTRQQTRQQTRHSATQPTQRAQQKKADKRTAPASTATATKPAHKQPRHTGLPLANQFSVFDDILREGDQTGPSKLRRCARPLQGQDGPQRRRPGCLGTRICPAYIYCILQHPQLPFLCKGTSNTPRISASEASAKASTGWPRSAAATASRSKGCTRPVTAAAGKAAAAGSGALRRALLLRTRSSTHLLLN